MAGVRNSSRHKAKRIAIYNHKGGVGKTTLTVNIGSALASLGYNVLLVDSDPQCNLTSYLVEEEVVDDYLDSSDDEDDGKTIWSALKPVAEGTGVFRTINAIERSRNLFLLPGDIRLAEYEANLADMWGDCFQRKMRGFRGVTALSMLVNEVARSNDIDYIFYDSGPNIGPLNKVILLDCDYFIVPAACDLFSLRALKTLGHTLTNWVMDWRMITNTAPDEIYLLPGLPKFLGYIPQRFRVYGGKLSSGYEGVLPKIEKSINDDIVVRLREVNVSLASGSMKDFKLGQVKEYGTLANAAQKEGEAIWRTTAGSAEQRVGAKESFLAIAKKIVSRIKD